MSSDFDQSMKDLLDISKVIISFSSIDSSFATKKEKKKSVKNPILKALENYSADYLLSDEEGNKDDVIITYKKIKAALLKGWKVDDWLKVSTISIHSGAIEPDDKRRIMISAIYNLACRHRDASKDNLKGLPVEAFDGHEELLFPAKFQLYMYRVFLFALDGEEFGDDITKLAAIVGELEKELKIAPLSAKKGENAEAPKSDNPLVDGFFGLAKDLVGKMGVQLPDNAQMPSNGGNIMEAAASIFTRPETKDFLVEVGESMKGAKDFGDAFQRVMGKFQDPGSVDRLKKMASSVIPAEMINGATQAVPQPQALEGAQGKQEE